jgi:[ribosomal protein S18]-alanine N-acetyltransferase
MNSFGRDPILRQADRADEFQLRRLLQRKSFVHRHLDWHPPLYWLGKQPFYLQELEEGGLLSALACPPDSSGLIWLRLFAAAPGFPLQRAWKDLWPAARAWLREHQPGAEIHSLAVNQELEDILKKADFQQISQVVSLVWDVNTARWPATRNDVVIRRMTPADLPRIAEIDRAAFQPLWRNTLDELQSALSVSFFATVGLIADQVRGYQISTANPQGGHLARLAVDPANQGEGIAIKILDDLLDSATQRGMVEVSVNTQRENQRSLALYQKFGFTLLEGAYPVLSCQV